MHRATTTDEIIRIASTQKGHILERQATPTALDTAIANGALYDGFSYIGDKVYELPHQDFPDSLFADTWAPWLSLMPDTPITSRLGLQFYHGLSTLDLYRLGVLNASSYEFLVHTSLRDHIDTHVFNCEVTFFDDLSNIETTTRFGIPTVTVDWALTELCVPWMEPQWYEEALTDAVNDGLINEERARALSERHDNCYLA